MGSVQRGIEVVEFAVRRAASAERRVLGIGRPRRRCLFAARSRSASAPGSRRSTFPAMVPLWMLPVALACGNTFILKPSEKDPVAVHPHGGAAEGSRAAGRRVQRRARRQGSGRRDPAASGDRRRLVRRLDADREATSTRRPRRRGSACRRWAARRTTRWCCPTPTSSLPPTPSSAPPTDRPASAAWRSRRSSPSATRGDPLVDAAGARRRRALKVGAELRGGRRHGPGRHRRSTASKILRYIDDGRRAGRGAVVDGRGLTDSRATSGASSSGRRCSIA